MVGAADRARSLVTMSEGVRADDKRPGHRIWATRATTILPSLSENGPPKSGRTRPTAKGRTATIDDTIRPTKAGRSTVTERPAADMASLDQLTGKLPFACVLVADMEMNQPHFCGARSMAAKPDLTLCSMSLCSSSHLQASAWAPKARSCFLRDPKSTQSGRSDRCCHV